MKLGERRLVLLGSTRQWFEIFLLRKVLLHLLIENLLTLIDGVIRWWHKGRYCGVIHTEIISLPFGLLEMTFICCDFEFLFIINGDILCV